MLMLIMKMCYVYIIDQSVPMELMERNVTASVGIVLVTLSATILLEPVFRGVNLGTKRQTVLRVLNLFFIETPF